MGEGDGTTAGTMPADVTARLQMALDRLPLLSGQPRAAELLVGGLTNVNVKVTTPERTAVLRLSGGDGDLLAIDRAAENTNSRRAAASGAAPPILDYLPELHVLVVEWVEGRTLTPEDLRDEGTLVRAADVCRTLHAGPRFEGDFDMFRIQRRYLSLVQERGFRLPPRYTELMPAADRIDDGNRLWVIDYEYGGNNDPCFELGNLCSESHLSLDRLELLVDSYYGRRLHHKVARARLLGLMSNFGWTLWASIQDAVSPIDFDFWGWGMDKYDRAVEEFDGPAFEGLLDAARRPD